MNTAPTEKTRREPTKTERDEGVRKRKERDEETWVDSGELPDVIRGGEGQERAANTPENEDEEVRQGT